MNVDDDEDNEDTPFSITYFMCLNVITDLCRLLSHGYSHLYRVFRVIRTSLVPTMGTITSEIIGDGLVGEDTIPLSLYDYIVKQLQIANSYDQENRSLLGHLRCLQGLQKLVYLMIIDDYLTVSINVLCNN